MSSFFDQLGVTAEQQAAGDLMGAGKEMWLAEYELILDEFAAGIIEEHEASARLKRLGFDPDEIEEHMEYAAS